MNRTDLATATVIGFFSLPSPSLAEHNTDAYNNAMAGAPEGAGTCAYCGTGIRHHVIIQTTAGTRAFIGTDCAGKIGGTVGECARTRITSEQHAARAARQQAQATEAQAARDKWDAVVSRRAAYFTDTLAALAAEGTQFHASLAEQLRTGSISLRQSRYVLKSVFGRRNKRNAEAYDTLEYDLCLDALEFDAELTSGTAPAL